VFGTFGAILGGWGQRRGEGLGHDTPVRGTNIRK
jgi:hypothetical protein